MRPLCTILLVFLLTNVSFAQIKRAKDAPKPLSPTESGKRFRLPKNLKIQLVASEPLIADPSCIAFDEKGRMFVCELHGYNLDGHEEIVELNKTGKLDRKIRRIRTVSPASKKRAEKGTYGTVKRLIDINGDGQMDRVQVWADRLPPCYGIIAARGGLIAVCAPDIVYLADRDGDGRAEVRQTLFTGFKTRVLERGINNPRWGPDNWIYIAAGGGGGLISGPKLKKPVQIGHTDFRIKPDGSAIEPVMGTTSTFGMTQNAFGERFIVAGGPCSYVVPLPHRYLIRNPHVPSPEPILRAGSYRRVYPRSKPHPWRVSRGSNPAWVKFYGKRETTPNGYFTSQCGQLLYLADSLPKPFHGNYFICDPSQNLIHRAQLTRSGPGYRLQRFHEEAKTEFLTSTDQWFRPMNLQLGPDGSIYVVDMYREIIEDFSAIPRYLQQQYGLVMGKDHGRIWRISTLFRSPKKEQDNWPAQMTSQELVKQLANDNIWWRQTAQRVLVERKPADAVDPLKQLAHQGSFAPARMHALYALAGIGRLQASSLIKPLTDKHPWIRIHALRLCEPFINTSLDIQQQVASMTGDKSQLVRVQLALTLGQWRGDQSTRLLAKLGVRDGDDAWVRGAILSSASQRSPQLIRRLLASPRSSAGLLRLLASSIGSRRNVAEIGTLLETAAKVKPGSLQQDLLDGLYAGVVRGGSAKLASRSAEVAMNQLLQTSSPHVRRRALQIARLMRMRRTKAMQEVWQHAVELAIDGKQPDKDRLQAIELLDSAPFHSRARLRSLLHVSQPLNLQFAVVGLLSKSESDEVSSVLLRGYKTLSPQVQSKIVDAHFARQQRVPDLLKAIERGVVTADSMTDPRRDLLTNSRDKAIAKRAKKLFAGRVRADRAKVIADFRTALSLRPNLKRGQAVFKKQCSKCHRIKDVGSVVGPDLRAIKNRANESLLIDMFDPSRKVKAGYRVFIVTMLNGRVHSGVLAEESATSITLKKEKAETQTLLRKNIEQMRSSPVSLMPNDLEKQVSKQDVADLLGYLKQSVIGKK